MVLPPLNGRMFCGNDLGYLPQVLSCQESCHCITTTKRVKDIKQQMKQHSIFALFQFSFYTCAIWSNSTIFKLMKKKKTHLKSSNHFPITHETTSEIDYNYPTNCQCDSCSRTWIIYIHTYINKYIWAEHIILYAWTSDSSVHTLHKHSYAFLLNASNESMDQENRPNTYNMMAHTSSWFVLINESMTSFKGSIFH